MALLHSPERNGKIERGLRSWIEADPANAAAWELATDVWDDTANLRRYMPSWNVSSTRRWNRRPLLAIALAVSCALICFTIVSLRETTVATGVGEQRTLVLDDGTRVQLNTDTRLKVDFDRHARRLVLDSGEAYFQVAHELRPFVVIAGDRKVVALGTEFTVRRDQSASDVVTVTLMEGRVAVEPVNGVSIRAATPFGDATVLEVGQRLHVRRHGRPALDAPPIDKVTGWIRGQVIFDHTPLRDAVVEISRYSRKPVVLQSSELGDLQIGGVFRIGDINSFAGAVAFSQNLEVIATDEGLVLANKK